MSTEIVTTEQPSNVPRPRITLVCVGKTYIQNGKIGLVFREINENGSAGAERIYSQKDLKHVRVGAVYEVEGSAENLRSIFTDTLRWLRLWEDKPEAAAWQAAADAFDTRDLAAKQEKNQNARKLPLELLEPIRKEYRRTNAVGRLAFEVRVLAYLRQVKMIDGPGE